MSDAGLSRKTAVLVFLALAFAYFLSAMVRAITATLSPTLIPEFDLQARDLGLLAGGYFLGRSLIPTLTCRRNEMGILGWAPEPEIINKSVTVHTQNKSNEMHMMATESYHK